MKILTDEELKVIRFRFSGVEAIRRSTIEAVLEKLNAQKPFAFHHDEEGLSYSNHYTGTVPLYKRPLPPDDVVRDAERYRWLRERNWSDSPLCVVTKPYEAVKLGYDCPSHDRLDAAIDAAMSER